MTCNLSLQSTFPNELITLILRLLIDCWDKKKVFRLFLFLRILQESWVYFLASDIINQNDRNEHLEALK